MIDQLRQAIHKQAYRITAHANDEMAADDLEAVDVESVIITGKIKREFTHDPRGTRFEVAGETGDGRRACVVCRVLPSGVLLIITAFLE